MRGLRPCVLVLRRTFDDSSVRLLKGISRYAEQSGWAMRRVDYSPDMGASFDPWRPIGVLADAGLAAEDLLAIPGLAGLPTVFCDLSLDAVGLGLPSFACVASDAVAVVDAAFGELARQGFGHFAYVPFADAACTWSRERGDVFARRVRAQGASLHLFVAAGGVEARTCALRSWLTGLPRPCGVFAANDVEAERVRDVCAAEGIGIPDEIALVGVDNRLDICESGTPTLTSVEQDFEACGYLSAQTLARLIAGELPTGSVRTFGVARVVRRASSRHLPVHDRHVTRALEFIRQHATDRISTADVVSAMGCRRSYACQRFRLCTGRTILDEIRICRVERIKDLIRDGGLELATLPECCGFASLGDLRRVFKAVTGQTLTQYRAALAEDAPAVR